MWILLDTYCVSILAITSSPRHGQTWISQNKDRKQNQIRTQEAGTHDTRQRIDITPPSQMARPTPNSSTGEGGGRSGGPSGMTWTGFTGRGPPEQNTERRPWRCRELRRPWQVVFVAMASSLGPATPAGTILPPKKFPWGI